MLNPLAPIATPAAPTPASTPAAPDDNCADGGFARALDQAGGKPRDVDGASRDAPAHTKDASHETAHDGSPAKAKEHASEQPSAQAARPGSTRGPRSAATPADDPTAGRRKAGSDVASDAVADAGAQAVAVEPASGDDGAATDAPADAEAMPQDLAAWLAALPLARPAAPDAAASSGPARPARGVSAAGDASAQPAAARGAPASDEGLSAADAAALATEGEHMPPASAAAPAHARATTRVLPEAATGRGLRSTDEASATAASLPAAAAVKDTVPKTERGADATSPWATLAAAPSGEASRGIAAKPAWQAEVHAAVGSDAFAPALGTQLRVMVRDGIEHAQLKLNPADLGPIEVRIDLLGAQAQVDFSAAHAATRQALQEAVPALAGALRESGLTLTGGGVFDQPREQRGETRQDGARPGTATSGGAGGTARETAAPQPARLSRARGAVDLYA